MNGANRFSGRNVGGVGLVDCTDDLTPVSIQGRLRSSQRIKDDDSERIRKTAGLGKEALYAMPRLSRDVRSSEVR